MAGDVICGRPVEEMTEVHAKLGLSDHVGLMADRTPRKALFDIAEGHEWQGISPGSASGSSRPTILGLREDPSSASPTGFRCRWRSSRAPPIGVELCRAERRMAPLLSAFSLQPSPGLVSDQLSCPHDAPGQPPPLCGRAAPGTSLNKKSGFGRQRSRSPSPCCLLGLEQQHNFPLQQASGPNTTTDTPDPDVSAAETQHQRRCGLEARWRDTPPELLVQPV